MQIFPNENDVIEFIFLHHMREFVLQDRIKCEARTAPSTRVLNGTGDPMRMDACSAFIRTSRPSLFFLKTHIIAGDSERQMHKCFLHSFLALGAQCSPMRTMRLTTISFRIYFFFFFRLFENSLATANASFPVEWRISMRKQSESSEWSNFNPFAMTFTWHCLSLLHSKLEFDSLALSLCPAIVCHWQWHQSKIYAVNMACRLEKNDEMYSTPFCRDLCGCV